MLSNDCIRITYICISLLYITNGDSHYLNGFKITIGELKSMQVN